MTSKLKSSKNVELEGIGGDLSATGRALGGGLKPGGGGL